ncbi:MAG: hypothetical protein ACR2OC_10920 [Solirubrobacterales bacterium]
MSEEKEMLSSLDAEIERRGDRRWCRGERHDLGDRVVAVGHVRTVGRESGVELDSPIGFVFTLRDGRP